MTAIVSNFEGAPRPDGKHLGIIPIDEAIDYVIGNTATLLTRPEGRTTLVMKVKTGSFLMKPGDYSGAFPTEPVATTETTTAGTGVWEMLQGESQAILAPSLFTVAGDSSSAKLRYYWV